DPRIKKDEEGNVKFKHIHDRPVTVTQEVEGDPDLKKERDEMIDAGYAGNPDAFMVDDRGMKVANPDYRGDATILTVIKVDQQIQDRFGKAMKYHPNKLEPDALKRFVERQKEFGEADNIMVKMADSGIFPYHPEWNFIPEGEPKGNDPQGKFIELVIVDEERLKAKLQEGKTEAQKKKIEKQIERYKMYKAISHAYDEVMKNAYSSFTKSDQDENVINEVYQILETIRTMYENGDLPGALYLCEDIPHEISMAFFQTNEDEKAEVLHLIKEKIISGGYSDRIEQLKEYERQSTERKKHDEERFKATSEKRRKQRDKDNKQQGLTEAA
ncbi:MAG: hypothetical protein ABIH21_00435, partial [Patescibacteria group bacterium]